jgi:hypothetical protein
LGKLDYSTCIKNRGYFSPVNGGFASGNICCVGESIFEPAVFDIKFEEGTTGLEVLAHEICPNGGEWGTLQ